MGYPYTLDNYQELAKANAQEMQKALKEEHTRQHQLYKDNLKQWNDAFVKAENNRRADETRWRNFYKETYATENAWLKNTVMFILNGVQLWALVQQYNQQKEIADRTYNLAHRQLALAEGMYNYYKEMFQPHEVALGGQIDGYFANPYRPQYETTSGRFALNARMQMIGKRREALMCASQYCTGALASTLKDLALQEANLVANAMNSGVKYEKLRQSKMDQKWLQTRLAFIQAGRGVAAQGITGIDGAVKAFHSFGADPGAALGQLLTTVARTVGGIIPTPSTRGTPAPVVEAVPAVSRPVTSVPRTSTTRTY